MTRTLNCTYINRPIGPLADDVANARRLLGMTDESIRRDVRELRQWLNDEPDLPNTFEGVDTDWWLENYLTINKNQVDRAKANLRVYFQLRNLIPEVMGNRNPETDRYMIQTYNSVLISLVPTIMDKSRKLVIFKHRADVPASNYHPVAVVKQSICIGEILFAEGFDHTSCVIVFDLGTFRLNHLVRYPIGLLRRFFFYVWKAYPERVAQIHIINPPNILSAVMALFKPFLKSKIRKRIIVHQNFESLLEHVPLKYLPKDYGGESLSLIELHEQWRQKVIDYQPYLNICLDRQRNVGQNKNTSDSSGSNN
ncbi:Cellular retinaldehyde binding/alpha-tocopherol transport,CRAL/TRIO, N-terminal domain,CRAL-TRIO lipid [Cinara cedri]|uniref:Cellular retinaldehyde binding/alpha-tocopherol transport,CRAL/TRIO, N-terminal domain,CRAL-TRIO lipid n=1 Tax=Cinara cedri TaxID=506608 RepID=A0A5E4M637_9HEMI|nr:Cellular retinaldehyde binding/alpha-tocopherol transport,CRAL/TRIO, N-terminal domain,CRAL-TRIO lipid [Cinara cedri]